MSRLDLPAHPDVAVSGVRPAWEGRFPLQLVSFSQRRFDGSMAPEREWELWRRGAAASVLPYDPWRDEVVLIEQFRLPALAAGLSPVLLEAPAGMCEDGETPERTVERELPEEVGLHADRLARIGTFLLSPGGCDETCTLFVGRVRVPPAGPDGLLGAGGLPAEGEDLRVRALPVLPLLERALDGAFPNSVLSLSLFWFAARRERLRTEWTR